MKIRNSNNLEKKISVLSLLISILILIFFSGCNNNVPGLISNYDASPTILKNQQLVK